MLLGDHITDSCVGSGLFNNLGLTNIAEACLKRKLYRQSSRALYAAWSHQGSDKEMHCHSPRSETSKEEGGESDETFVLVDGDSDPQGGSESVFRLIQEQESCHFPLRLTCTYSYLSRSTTQAITIDSFIMSHGESLLLAPPILALHTHTKRHPICVEACTKSNPIVSRTNLQTFPEQDGRKPRANA